MIFLTKPILAAAAIIVFFMALAVVHYKLRGDNALDRLEKQVAQTAVWKLNAEDMKTAVAKQNRAIDDMKREQELKDAQNALALSKAKDDTKAAQTRAKSLATRTMPSGVTDCTAASQLFEEVLYVAQ